PSRTMRGTAMRSTPTDSPLSRTPDISDFEQERVFGTIGRSASVFAVPCSRTPRCTSLRDYFPSDRAEPDPRDSRPRTTPRAPRRSRLRPAHPLRAAPRRRAGRQGGAALERAGGGPARRGAADRARRRARDPVRAAVRPVADGHDAPPDGARAGARSAGAACAGGARGRGPASGGDGFGGREPARARRPSDACRGVRVPGVDWAAVDAGVARGVRAAE